MLAFSSISHCDSDLFHLLMTVPKESEVLSAWWNKKTKRLFIQGSDHRDWLCEPLLTTTAHHSGSHKQLTYLSSYKARNLSLYLSVCLLFVCHPIYNLQPDAGLARNPSMVISMGETGKPTLTKQRSECSSNKKKKEKKYGYMRLDKWEGAVNSIFLFCCQSWRWDFSFLSTTIC